MNTNQIKKQPRVLYAKAVYGEPEVRAVSAFLRSGKPLAGGEYTHEFEAAISRIFGKKFGVFVNSGSSANLIAMELLNAPRGSEVITPLLTFGTTLSPIVQKGLVPVFADVEPGTYAVNPDHVEKLIGKKTKALMIPSLIGNLPDMERLRDIARRHRLVFIEDSCDTLGAMFNGKPSGKYSDISTTSFYAPHIITTAGCGGMVCMNNSAWYDRARMLRAWGRTSSLFGESEDIAKRFRARLGSVPYDAKFIFQELGYNFIPHEIGAVFGLEQVKRLPQFARSRKENFARLVKFFSRYEHFFILPRLHPKTDTVLLAFPLTIRTDAPFSRRELVTHLEKNNIQTRPVFTGNALRHPSFRTITHRKFHHAYPETDAVMERGFLIGAHHGMTGKEQAHLCNTVEQFLKKY